MIPRPTLADIVRRNEAELVLETASAPLRRNLFTPLARALSGAEHGLYGHQDWIARQIHPQSCDDDTLLEVFVPIYLPAGRKPPSAASGVIKLSGAAGYPIAAGELLGRGDDAQFALVDGVTLPAAGQITAKVIATAPGQAGNTEPGSKLRLVNTVPGINGEAEVLPPGLSGGADIEGIEEVRARVIEARRNGGQVGRTTDWEIWAKEVAGVTRAWAVPKLLGNGSISVYFVRDGDADIFPDAAEQAAVLAHLEQTGTPMGEIYALAPINKPINFTIRLTPDTPAIRQAVVEALAAVLASEAAPVKRADGRTSLPVSGATIPRSHLTEAISGAPGEWDHQLVAPAADVVCGIGELATLGAITWL
ncbi:baseplate J/gp47 family protein [Chromobacterium haemolyticum]|uniref:baseplate J/gp47 family protein n=1 Tax=Chromobacterium haemolyticum TaxID=394935 RepID=UPI000DEFB16D|nr:baseplate J/gp47 family protein [Chromobacterium haemolyticum]